ncbi:FKBP-type peptidyl-prolyl cis-trans isomerase [Flindersiella endophytica]
MRRALAIVVAPALLLAAAACGSGAAEKTSDPKAKKTAANPCDTAAASPQPGNGAGAAQRAQAPAQKRAQNPAQLPTRVDSTIDSVTVSGAASKKPTLKFDKPYKAAQTESKVISAGKGEKIAKNDAVVVNYVGINARDGKEFDTSWAEGRSPAIFTLQDGALIKGFLDGLIGKKVGDRVLISIASKDGYADGNEQAGIKKGDSLLFVVDLMMKPTATAVGKEVKPASGMPSLKLDAKKQPSIIMVPQTDPPKQLKKQALVEGSGAAVTKDSTVAVHMVGSNWRTCKVIESSWQKGQPYVLPLDRLGVKGLLEGLVGAKAGSRVEIVIPPDKGFGQDLQGTDVKKSDTIVFVVDILGVA